MYFTKEKTFLTDIGFSFYDPKIDRILALEKKFGFNSIWLILHYYEFLERDKINEDDIDDFKEWANLLNTFLEKGGKINFLNKVKNINHVTLIGTPKKDSDKFRTKRINKKITRTGAILNIFAENEVLYDLLKNLSSYMNIFTKNKIKRTRNNSAVIKKGDINKKIIEKTSFAFIVSEELSEQEKKLAHLLEESGIKVYGYDYKI